MGGPLAKHPLQSCLLLSLVSADKGNQKATLRPARFSLKLVSTLLPSPSPSHTPQLAASTQDMPACLHSRQSHRQREIHFDNDWARVPSAILTHSL